MNKYIKKEIIANMIINYTNPIGVALNKSMFIIKSLGAIFMFYFIYMSKKINIYILRSRI